jgi:hypothetical protein
MVTHGIPALAGLGAGAVFTNASSIGIHDTGLRISVESVDALNRRFSQPKLRRTCLIGGAEGNGVWLAADYAR